MNLEIDFEYVSIIAGWSPYYVHFNFNYFNEDSEDDDTMYSRDYKEEEILDDIYLYGEDTLAFYNLIKNNYIVGSEDIDNLAKEIEINISNGECKKFKEKDEEYERRKAKEGNSED